MAPALILASASPRRRELLERVGVPLEVRPADVDETPLPDEAPRAYVVRVAAAKASAAAVPGRFVLAADTTVTVGGAILGKPADAADAAAMLRALSGRVHEVITAFAITGPRSTSGVVAPLTSGVIATDVDVIALDERAIAEYVASGEWRGKAGGYAIQGIAAAFVRGVRGSVTNVIGLPLVEVLAALHEVGAPSARLASGAPA